MNLKLSKDINEIIAYSREEAMRTGNYSITPDMLTLGIIRHKENAGYDLMMDLHISIPYLKLKINDKITKDIIIPFEEADKISFSAEVQNVLKIMILDSHKTNTPTPNSLNLLLAILKSGNNIFAELISGMGLSYSDVKSKAFGDSDDSLIEKDEEDISPEPDNHNPPSRKNKKESVLESYSYDLTKAAREDRLDPVVGREKEIERLAQILCRRKKNNPILIGEPGVGKSAIAEGLAIKIAKHNVSRSLMDKRIVSLDIGAIVAGTKLRGQFEERIKSILKELKDNTDIILFIDEMHTLVGAGGAIGSLDAANLMKPALARGELQCIGATTYDEFREIIEKDGALERRFQKIMVEPTSFDETLDILENIKYRYEHHHNVTYSPEAIRACISLSTRYISDRHLPDKAIDLLDEAGSRAHLQTMKLPKNLLNMENELDVILQDKRNAVKEEDFEKAKNIRFAEKRKRKEFDDEMDKWENKQASEKIVITADDIAQVISLMTKIPVNKIATSESNRLLSMGEVLRERVIGQDEAVDKVVKAIQRNRAGLKDPNKPIGTFLFLGPTGVGKTQLAKVLAEYMFDTQESIIRIDMSEYMEKFAVSRLIGAPPGYVGYEEGGQLSERVRRKPYSVVLLDEIEKAHPDIFNILLQVLDEGRLTDSNGRYIDFRNTVLIMTSNIGSRELKDFGKGIGYVSPSVEESGKKGRSIVEKAIGKMFNPEFLNRLDEQIYFNSLTKSDIEKIIEIELVSLYDRIKEAGYKLYVGKEAKKFLADVGYDPRYGARPLKRAIQKYIEDPVSEAIISGCPLGSTIKMALSPKKDRLVVRSSGGGK